MMPSNHNMSAAIVAGEEAQLLRSATSSHDIDDGEHKSRSCGIGSRRPTSPLLLLSSLLLLGAIFGVVGVVRGGRGAEGSALLGGDAAVSAGGGDGAHVDATAQDTDGRGESGASGRGGDGVCSSDGFNDELPEKPVATTFLTTMPGLGLHEARMKEGRCARELVNLPVVTSNDAYRLGNAVERQGVGWIGARRLVLEDERAYKDSILFNFLMGENEEQRAFVGCVVAHKRRLERMGVEPHLMHGDNNTIVIPLRLSDKVRFVVEDYPVITTAIREYRRQHCPWCENLVIMTLLVWGEDKNHMFAYTYDEYKQSLTVLHAIAKKAQSPEGGGLHVSVRSTLNADNDFVYSAYSPHLVLPMVTPSSWHQLLTYSNRAVFDAKREAASITFFDNVIAPKLELPGRRQRLLNAYARLEASVPETKVTASWFQSEVRRRGLDEHRVTVSQMLTWRDWPSIIGPYVVGMKAYDKSVRRMAEAERRDHGEEGEGSSGAPE